ncbi:MarR family winged helix-turn-helix transcriptional regulator [Geotalea uraniireducens]|uniref:Transcriptional regulator, MarR family n=1 Tax=Geotalea uraniireducens (strain Rf4) TaxID=351605 RepID=A5GE97_GEOUR|nr:MarR family transcriptional regulator [Geotalea uraniireducens]ABQ25752.1 transcriptional regulator, MarR family [Geotalea uraniireducens Rf4]
MKNRRQGGFLIAKIHQLAGRIFSRKLKKYEIADINPAQGRILFVLWENDGISIQELAVKTSLGKSTLTSMLDRLEETGHLTRVPSSDDRRKILIKLTEKDRALRNQYARVSEDMTELFYSGFSAAEIDMFEGFLQRILGNLQGFETKEQACRLDSDK